MEAVNICLPWASTGLLMYTVALASLSHVIYCSVYPDSSGLLLDSLHVYNC